MIKVDFKYAVVAEALGEASRRLSDMTPIHHSIGNYVVRATKERFKKGIDPDGNAWTPKKQATIDRYKERGDGNRPDPLIGPSKRLSSEIAQYADAQGVEIGSALEYPAVMQNGAKQGAFGKSPRGGPIPWGDIPARPWLGLSEEDEANIIDIADEYLEQAFNLSGFNG